MIVETFNAEQTWRQLWSRAAQQAVARIPAASRFDCESIGYGWGLRSRSNPQHALVLHPSSNMRGIGDLAITMLGAGTRVIPRHNASFVEYVRTVADVVEDTLTRPQSL